MKVAFPFGEGGPLAVDEVLVIKDFYCQLLGETRYYKASTKFHVPPRRAVRLGKEK